MSGTRRLLIIDDNTELVENLMDIFEPRGFSVHVVARAAAGLETARREGFELAFVDVNLPDSSGLDLLPALRAAVPLGEVVLMTGHATIDSAIAAVRGGAFHYVVKPFKADDLIATAESALRQVELRRERQHLAHQLEASERRYRDVVESAQVLVLGTDTGGLLQMVNRRAAEVAGFGPSELEGRRSFESLFPPEMRENVHDRIAAAAQGKVLPEFEAPMLTRDGRIRTIRWHTTPALASGGDDDMENVAVYVIGSDVTERKQLERRAAEAEALAHMGTLAAGLAHEIRNPLNAAGLQLHLLARNVERLAEDERQGLRARIDIVAGELKRLERLLSDFLELARPRPIAREPVDMEQLLGGILALHEAGAQERGVNLVSAIHRANALGDRERLKQVFHNLVLNALEATAAGGQVQVECTLDPSDPPSVVVTVSDSGRGIPAAALERVFEAFFTTKEAGTGLGLSIVRQIIQRHGGTVHLESAEGRGTRVSVRIPAAPKETASHTSTGE
jgi:PAS domain S-box-containing protein